MGSSTYNLPSNVQSIIDARELVNVLDKMTDDRQALMREFDECHERHSEAMRAVDDLPVDESEEELTVAVAQLTDAVMELTDAERELGEWDTENGEDFEMLKDVINEIDSYAEDARNGASLIHEDYFETYAEEWANDVGLADTNGPASNIITSNIDWRGVAKDLQENFIEIDYDGETYWIHG